MAETEDKKQDELNNHLFEAIDASLKGGKDKEKLWSDVFNTELEGDKERRELNKQLFEAISANDKHSAEQLLQKGANANEMYYSGTYHIPLCTAQDAEMAELLIKYGAQANKTFFEGTPLHSVKNAAVAEVLIRHGADVNSMEDDSGRPQGAMCTPLHRAVQYNDVPAMGELPNDTSPHEDVVQVLINHGANLEIRDLWYGATPLGWDVTPAVAKMLIDHGADVSAKDRDGGTPLFRTHDPDTAEILIAHGADINARDDHGRTPLHEVKGSLSELLIKKGANINARDNYGRTPLFHKVGSESELKFFIANGADVTVVDEDGRTVLHHVMSHYDYRSDNLYDIAKFLTEKGANATARDNSGQTPLLDLKWPSDPYTDCKPLTADITKTINLLLAKGDNINVKDNNGDTLLHKYIPHANFIRVRDPEDIEAPINFLIDKGIDINAQNNEGRTPLHTAVQENSSLVTFLIDKGAKISTTDKMGMTPLHLADSGYAAQALIENGADVNARNNNDETPLHVVNGHDHRRGRDNPVLVLITNKADIHAKDKEGNTPLHKKAAQSFQIDDIKFLVENGADINAKNNIGQSPLQIAAEKKLIVNARYLLESGATIDKEIANSLRAFCSERLAKQSFDEELRHEIVFAYPKESEKSYYSYTTKGFFEDTLKIIESAEKKQGIYSPSTDSTNLEENNRADASLFKNLSSNPINFIAPIVAFVGVIGAKLLSGAEMGIGTILAAIGMTAAVAVAAQYFTGSGLFAPSPNAKNSSAEDNKKKVSAKGASPELDKQSSLDNALRQYEAGYRPAVPADAPVTAPPVLSAAQSQKYI